MADFTKTVDLIFGGKDQVSPTIRDITKSLDSFQTGVQKISSPMAAVTDSILKLDAAILALSAGALAFAINDAIKLQSAQLDLQKVLGSSEGSVSDYTGKIKDLSLTYGVLQTDTTASVAEIRQANFSIADSFQIVEDSLIATKISELSAAEASTLLVQTLKGFDLEASQSRVILDTWNETSNNFATNTREIATGLAQVSGVANLAGLSIDKTTALLVPMIEVFGSGAEAATALRTGLLKVSDDSAPVIAALDKMGISQTNVNGTFKSAGEIFFEVIANLGKLSDAEQLHTVQQLVGINQSDKLVQTFTKQGEILDILTALTGKEGSALNELKIRMEAAEEAINRLNTAFHVFEDAIGGKFLTSTKDVSSALTNILIAASNIVDQGGLDVLFNQANGFAAKFADTLNLIAQNLPAAVASPQVQAELEKLSASLKSLGLSVGDLFGGVDLTSEKGLEDAITRLIKIFESLVNITKGITDKYLYPLFTALGAGVSGFSELDGSTQNLIGSFLGVGKSVDVLIPLVGSLFAGLGGLFQIFGGIKGIKVETSILAAATATDAFAIASKGLFLLAWGDFVYKLASWADLNDRLIPGIDTLGTKIYEWTHSSDQAATATVNLTKPLDDLGKSINEYSDSARAAATSSGELAKSGSFVEEQFTAALLPFDKLVQSLNGVNTETTKSISINRQWADQIKSGATEFSDSSTAISNKYRDTGTAAEDAAKKTDEYQLKLLELASDERIKLIEATVTLNVAELQSKTEIAKSILDGLATTITSTGDVLGTLFGTLKEDLSFQNLFLVQKAIESETQLRADAIRKQNELIDAQIEQLKAQTDALSNGDSLITITGDGLAPELEAFMMKVLERIQIRASQDRSLYLLGLPA